MIQSDPHRPTHTSGPDQTH